jgi:hypothetical protein
LAQRDHGPNSITCAARGTAVDPRRAAGDRSTPVTGGANAEYWQQIKPSHNLFVGRHIQSAWLGPRASLTPPYKHRARVRSGSQSDRGPVGISGRAGITGAAAIYSRGVAGDVAGTRSRSAHTGNEGTRIATYQR